MPNQDPPESAKNTKTEEPKKTGWEDYNDPEEVDYQIQLGRAG